MKANRLDYIAATSPATIFTATSGKVIVLEEAICFIDADAVSARVSRVWLSNKSKG